MADSSSGAHVRYETTFKRCDCGGEPQPSGPRKFRDRHSTTSTAAKSHEAARCAPGARKTLQARGKFYLLARRPDAAVIGRNGQRGLRERRHTVQIQRAAVQFFDVLAPDGNPERHGLIAVGGVHSA